MSSVHDGNLTMSDRDVCEIVVVISRSGKWPFPMITFFLIALVATMNHTEGCLSSLSAVSRLPHIEPRLVGHCHTSNELLTPK